MMDKYYSSYDSELLHVLTHTNVNSQGSDETTTSPQGRRKRETFEIREMDEDLEFDRRDTDRATRFKDSSQVRQRSNRYALKIC